MNNCEDPSERAEDLPASLPRSSSTTDFSKLFRRCPRAARKYQSRCSQSYKLSDRSEAYGSENSQVLYMAPPKKPRPRDRSLSSISNGSARRLDGSSDTKDDVKEGNIDDEISWSIIDREIFDWQYVCQTGRPYWWSPEAKYHCLKKLPPRTMNEPIPRIWMKQTDERPKAAYGVQRRAVSDSFLSDPETVHDLAHLVAIQLLGACFTLPPDSIEGLPAPNYTTLDKKGPTSFPDPRMISSLRMHTNFRYSPSFGHQPRNTSPVQVWPGHYDGPSRNSSSRSATTWAASPDIRTSGSLSKRPRVHRALHVTEGSDSIGSEVDDFDQAAAKTANVQSVKITRLPKPKSRSSKHHSSTEYEDKGGSDAYRGSQPSQQSPRRNYRLQPMIRSEPHHVYVQPVRELVVKRWRSFRRRFGSSLHSALPTSQSEYPTSASESGASEASSPAVSSDAKMRRPRAQERGDIHSSSIDSTPHYNSPASDVFTTNPSGRISPCSIESNNVSTLPLAGQPMLADPLRTAESAPPKSRQSILETALPSDTSISPRSQTHPTSSILASCGSSHSGFEFLSSKSASPTSSHSYSSRKTANRLRRRSMLSEVCTPDDFGTPLGTNTGACEVVDRSILSAVGSTLASPREESPPTSSTKALRQRYQEAMSGPSFSGFMGMTELRGTSIQERPRMSRTSTSGTQVFTPEADGVELDGLPVGPDRSRWARKGGRRERTYL
jgi:hypothetical protein